MPVDGKIDRYVWLFRLFIASIFLLLIIRSISPLWQRLRQQKELTGLQEKMAASKQEENRLRLEIDMLKNDNNYIELMARKKLGMVKPGEESYLVVEERSPNKKGK